MNEVGLEMKDQLSCNVSIITERMGRKVVYLARCEELGISDFGDTIEEALKHLKTSLSLLIKYDSSKAEPLKKKQPLLTTRLFL